MVETNFTPFPVLTTQRLVLRSLEATDDKDIFAHRCDDVVNTYLEGFRHASIEETRAFIDRVQKETAIGKTILWVLTQKGQNKFMGAVSLWNIVKDEDRAEAGYTLDAAFHGKGYMNEALVKVFNFGFNTMKLKIIDAYTHEHNNGSIRLLQRNGFIQGTPQKPVAGNRLYFSLTKKMA
ncbi:GNAT family N-acetyltransferase [Chitinophagaceae bacterium MMS25-I14]